MGGFSTVKLCVFHFLDFLIELVGLVKLLAKKAIPRLLQIGNEILGFCIQSVSFLIQSPPLALTLSSWHFLEGKEEKRNEREERGRTKTPLAKMLWKDLFLRS